MRRGLAIQLVSLAVEIIDGADCLRDLAAFSSSAVFSLDAILSAFMGFLYLKMRLV